MSMEYKIGIVTGYVISTGAPQYIINTIDEIRDYLEKDTIIHNTTVSKPVNKSVELIENIKNGKCFDKESRPEEEIIKSSVSVRPCDISVGVRVPRLPTSIEIKYNDDYYAFPINTLEDLEYISEDILITRKTLGIMIVNKYRRLLQEYDLTLGKYSIDEYPYKNNFIKISKRHYESSLKGKSALSSVESKKRTLRGI